MTQAIPAGFHSVTPSLILNNAASAIELYKKAFGAQEVYRMQAPDSSKIMHACITIGNSMIFLSDVAPEMGCSTPSVTNFYVYLDNVDKAFTQAKQTGLAEVYAVQDMFWGDRTGTLKDNFGIQWTLATHVRDVSEDELEEGRQKWAAAS